jgi:methyl-accepting chemotaxis protein
MITKFKLAQKFTLLLSLVFIATIFMSGYILSHISEEQAKKDVSMQGLLMMDMINSVRTYTNQNINPLFKAEDEDNFIPETIPTYSAKQVFKYFQEQPIYQELKYKEAMLNPTNINDKADEFEINLIKQFQQNDQLNEVWGFRKQFGKPVLYKARPIKITKESCLRCHSTPEKAPKAMLKIYGTENGFGWPLNQAIGTQTIYVPAADFFNISRQYLILVMGTFVGIFAVVILVINFLLKRKVIEPIREMAWVAYKISNDQITSEEIEKTEIKKLEKVSKNSDELGQLARLFQQMVSIVYAREQGLKQQLQQLLSETEKIKQSNSLAKSRQKTYLQHLLDRAKRTRN